MAARNQGNQADYMLGTTQGWDAFGVVRWHGIEELSRPYRYDITLQRPATSGPVDLDKLLDAGTTLRIASQQKWRGVHGILAEAEQIDRTSQLILYRVLLVPHFWRARYRRRCRNFLGKSLVDIVSAVLENRSPDHPQGMGGLARFTSSTAPDPQPDFNVYATPTATYRWDVKDTSRIEDTHVRPYVVQYNESDFDFVSRLLEDEGLSYYFEHGDNQVTLTITDQPGVSPKFDEGSTFTLRRLSKTGGAQQQEIVRSFRDTRRLRSRAVTVRDWDYHRSAAPLEAKVDESTGDPDLSRHFEFPVGEESVRKEPGQHAAKVRIERYDAERAMREGMSNVRTMEPGYRFMLRDGDGIESDAKLLAVRVETFATELAPQGTILDEEPWGFADAPGALTPGYDSRFLALGETVAFRPAMLTPRPRIHGVQAGVVTAEELPEGNRPAVHGDERARVRVRFPWDQRPDIKDKTPTSRWIRVSQFWAGAGYGALYMPRVGHEVLVAYMQGDPDQPVIVGRVYNAQHPPPYDPSREPTKSTVKGQSAEESKEVDGFNEIRFDDKAKHEQIYVHAQRNLDEVVLASHSTTVGGDQSNVVGGNQRNQVGGGRNHTVGGEEHVTVERDRTTLFKLNEHHTVLVSRDTHIHASELHEVGVYRKTEIGGNDDLDVKGWRNAVVKGGDTVTVTDQRHVKVGGVLLTEAKGNIESDSKGAHLFTSKSARFELTEEFIVKVGGGTELRMTPGSIFLKEPGGAQISINGGLIQITGPTATNVKSGPCAVDAAGAVKITGTAVNVKGNPINLGE